MILPTFTHIRQFWNSFLINIPEVVQLMPFLSRIQIYDFWTWFASGTISFRIYLIKVIADKKKTYQQNQV